MSEQSRFSGRVWCLSGRGKRFPRGSCWLWCLLSGFVGKLVDAEDGKDDLMRELMEVFGYISGVCTAFVFEIEPLVSAAKREALMSQQKSTFHSIVDEDGSESPMLRQVRKFKPRHNKSTHSLTTPAKGSRRPRLGLSSRNPRRFDQLT